MMDQVHRCVASLRDVRKHVQHRIDLLVIVLFAVMSLHQWIHLQHRDIKPQHLLDHLLRSDRWNHNTVHWLCDHHLAVAATVQEQPPFQLRWINLELLTNGPGTSQKLVSRIFEVVVPHSNTLSNRHAKQISASRQCNRLSQLQRCLTDATWRHCG